MNCYVLMSNLNGYCLYLFSHRHLCLSALQTLTYVDVLGNFSQLHFFSYFPTTTAKPQSATSMQDLNSWYIHSIRNNGPCIQLTEHYKCELIVQDHIVVFTIFRLFISFLTLTLRADQSVWNSLLSYCR